MKKYLLVTLLSCWGIACSVTNANQTETKTWKKPQISFEELKSGFKEPGMKYAPYAFWFWDDKLDVERVRTMAEEMAKKGLNPGYVHPRSSSVEENGKPASALPDKEWLSHKWFEAYNAAVEGAKEHNAFIGYCDEYWTPWGRANGRTIKKHPELKPVSVLPRVRDINGGMEITIPDNPFFTVVAKHGSNESLEPDLTKSKSFSTDFDFINIKSSTMKLLPQGIKNWKAPEEGIWRVYTFYKYHGEYDITDVNYLDRSLAKKYLAIAQEPYKKNVPELGKTVSGVFIDNEGYYAYKLGWSNDFEKEFRKKKGKDLRLVLPLMLDNDVEGTWPKARYDWYDVAGDIYADFFGELNDWCVKQGMYCISNLWEETLTAQALRVGDFFKQQRRVTMPGTDALTLKVFQVHDFKETQSVSEFENRRFMTEILGVAGFQMTPDIMKQAINSVICWGTSHIVPHGVYFNRDMTKTIWPPDWYDINPYWPYLKHWTDFVRRSSYVASHGHTEPDVLLLNPMTSVYTLMGGDYYKGTDNGAVDRLFNSEEGIKNQRNTIKQIEQVYTSAINNLTDARIEYLIADRYYFGKMEITPNHTLRYKDFNFKTLVVPTLFALEKDLARKLVDFAKAGGKVCLLGDLPVASPEGGMNDPEILQLMQELKKQPSVIQSHDNIPWLVNNKHLQPHIEFISGAFKAHHQHKKIDGKDFYWIINNSTQPQQCEIKVLNQKGQAAKWDCETGTILEVASIVKGSDSYLKLSFEPNEAFWLVFDNKKENITTTATESPKKEMVIEGQWKVFLDLSVQRPHPIPKKNYRTKLPVTESGLVSWRSWGGMDEFSGLIDYEKNFNLSSDAEKIVLNLGKVNYVAEVWVNNQHVGSKLWAPFKFDVTRHLKKGKNSLKVRVGNLLTNATYEAAQKYYPHTLVWFPDNREGGLFGPVKLIWSVKN